LLKTIFQKLRDIISLDGGQCKVCFDGRLVSFEKRLNINGNIDDMYICSNCFVIMNYTRQAQDLTLQKTGLTEFYRYTESEIVELRPTIESHKGIIANILDLMPAYHRQTFLEIGSGRGTLLIAASEIGFKSVVGVDLSLSVFEETKKHVKVGDNITMYHEISEVHQRADCIVMWHTLEHIFEPAAFFMELKKVQNRGCLLYFQVPQYHQPYICDTHHYFYNEPSIRALMKKNGYKTLRVEYDTVNQFLTVIAKAVN